MRKRVSKPPLIHFLQPKPKPTPRPAIRRTVVAATSSAVCAKCKANAPCDYIDCTVTPSNTKDFTACRETTFGGHECKQHRNQFMKEIQRTGATLKLPPIIVTKAGIRVRGFRLNNMCVRVPVNGQLVIIDCSGVFVQCSMQGLFDQNLLSVSLHLNHYLNTNVYHIGVIQNSRILYGDLSEVYVLRDASMLALRNQSTIVFPTMVCLFVFLYLFANLVKGF
jgi:hypothetical protein